MLDVERVTRLLDIRRYARGGSGRPVTHFGREHVELDEAKEVQGR